MRPVLQQKVPFRAARRAWQAWHAWDGQPPLRPDGPETTPWIQFGLPTGFAYRKATLPIPGLPAQLEGLRILHLSDFHLRSHWGRPYDQLIEMVQLNAPDLILFTGDFVDSKHDHRPALPLVRRLVPKLRARLGFYAVQGNHDPDMLLPHLAEMGVEMITHRRVVLAQGATQLELIGLGGFIREEFDPDFIRRLPPRRDGDVRIVLSHYPDLFGMVRALEPDIYLAGHTHGGQICLPGGRPIFSHDSLPKRLAKGIHRIGSTWYAVSQGMGFSGVPLRLFCPAQCVEFKLVRPIGGQNGQSPAGQSADNPSARW